MVVQGRRDMHCFVSAQINIKQGISLWIAMVSLGKSVLAIRSWFCVGVKMYGSEQTLAFPPKLAINEGSKIHSLFSFLIALPSCRHHSARRVRPVGAE